MVIIPLVVNDLNRHAILLNCRFVFA